MYDPIAVKKDLSKWIIDTLSKDNSAFGGMPPCPYARTALLQDRIEIVIVDESTDITLTRSILEDGNDVVAYIFDPAVINPADLTDIAVTYNKRYKDLVFLEDHPAEVEQVAGFVVNQGKYACIFGAKRNGVLKAREHLKTTKYYDNWDEDYKQTVWSR